MTNNDILIAVALLERTLPKLNENTRVSIRRDTLGGIHKNLDMCIGKITPYTTDVGIMMPLVEMVKLIDTLLEDGDFAECSDEVKRVFVDKTHMALNALYLFAGKYYEDHDFDYSQGMTLNIIRIIESCLAQGYYFGFEKQFTKEVL